MHSGLWWTVHGALATTQAWDNACGLLWEIDYSGPLPRAAPDPLSDAQE